MGFRIANERGDVVIGEESIRKNLGMGEPIAWNMLELSDVLRT